MNDSKPKVDLFEFDGLGLIILFPSGAIYTNQVGGYGCFHPEVEGVFVPLSVNRKKILFAFQSHFKGSWHHITENDAIEIDKLLRDNELSFIQVNREKLSNSFEAWIYVSMDESREKYSILSGFGNIQGVLTWANSD